ncbi:hypothetical protein IAU59_002494 [Kwoniella sp. CBS 9459]
MNPNHYLSMYGTPMTETLSANPTVRQAQLSSAKLNCPSSQTLTTKIGPTYAVSVLDSMVPPRDQRISMFRSTPGSGSGSHAGFSASQLNTIVDGTQTTDSSAHRFGTAPTIPVEGSGVTPNTGGTTPAGNASDLEFQWAFGERASLILADVDLNADDTYSATLCTILSGAFASRTVEQQEATCASHLELGEQISTALRRRVLSVHGKWPVENESGNGQEDLSTIGTKEIYSKKDEVEACHEAIQRIADDHMLKNQEKSRDYSLYICPENVPGSILSGFRSEDETVKRAAAQRVITFIASASPPSTGLQNTRAPLEIDRGWQRIVSKANGPMSIAEDVAWRVYLQERRAQREIHDRLWKEESEE